MAGVTVTLTGAGPDGVFGNADDTTAVKVSSLPGAHAYSFTNVKGGLYKVTFSDLPAGLEFTQPDAGADNRDSDADPATGMTQPFTLAPGERNLTIDAGLVRQDIPDPETGIISNKVWLDENENGLFDNGEQGIKGVKVVLTSAGLDGIIDTADDITETKIFSNTIFL